MTSNFNRLTETASKKDKFILGLMSGTSMDGLDMALCRMRGHGINTNLELEEFVTVPHTAEYQKKVRQVFAKPDARAEELAVLDQYIAEVMADQILAALDLWDVDPADIDLIASHGQTVYHNPATQSSQDEDPRSVTMQLGDGDFLARRTSIITVSDFRQKHIAGGGEGAPLAMYGDLLLFSHPEESRILINIGGIANFTWLPATRFNAPPLSTDTGPGNTMMDAYMQKHYNQPFDRDSKIGDTGEIDLDLMRALLDDPFFYQPLPRSTGPEKFNMDYLDQKLSETGNLQLNKADILATLYGVTVESIYAAMLPFISQAQSIFVSGGGIHNPMLMFLLQASFSKHKLRSTDELGIDPDAKEAVIFAVLGHECLFGIPGDYPDLGEGHPQISMGKVSFPW